MRKYAVLAASVVLLSGGMIAPAWAERPPEPTGVQVSWAGDQIRVTWLDQGEANVVWGFAAGRETVLARVAAADANEVLVPASSFPASSRAQIMVGAIDAEGNESALRGYSRTFDTLRPARPDMRHPQMRPDSSVELVWAQGTVDDENPGDPLDRTDATWLKATVAGPGTAQQHYPMPLDDNQYFAVPAPPQLSTITISSGNEWGTSAQTGPRVRVGITRVDAPVNPTKVFGAHAVPMATVHRFLCACAEDLNPEIAGVGVDLQARPNSSAPWQVVKSNAGPVNTAIDLSDGLVGSRQYRVWVPENSWYSNVNKQYEVMRPLSTAPRTSLTLSNFVKTGFVPSTAPVSATVKLNVEARPLVDKLAALQRWDGKQWRYVRDIKLIHGAASIPIRAAGRGTTTKYRILVPRIIYKGLPIETTTSKPFTLTVR
ncbi:hypothetical protein GCM10029976_050570 [Kribbella albertanoniae]|uniref:Fibronectin type III domain-containing protein n=1 Tax=Kribbella albertanoniae TaxID=1266829 RepID=A0A4R4Q5I2_9ACTN|nr:hypothetical protein [Kribbella albertanoniae]TDC30123.1 hypothetical protein E1261_14160 [Kribbella albertanoniae]